MGKDFLVMMLEETHHTFLDWIVLYQKVTTLIQSLIEFFFFLLSTDLLTWILVTFTLQSIVLSILFVLAVLHNMWGLSFLTRAQIRTPCIGNLEY